jgi:hypothetical protein
MGITIHGDEPVFSYDEAFKELCGTFGLIDRKDALRLLQQGLIVFLGGGVKPEHHAKVCASLLASVLDALDHEPTLTSSGLEIGDDWFEDSRGHA